MDRFVQIGLTNAVLAALLALAVLVVSRYSRRPALLHLLWLLVLVRLLFPPLVALPILEWPSALDIALPWSELLIGLGVLWLMGSVVYFGITGYRILRFARLLRHARPAPVALQNEADSLAKQLGLRRAPRLILLPGPIPPLLWAVGGWSRMLFPEALLGQLDEAGRHALLTHELAHLVRRDHWGRLLELFVSGLYWWCPVAWLASRRLAATEEECCDCLVVQTMPGYSAAYAGALLQTVQLLSARATIDLPVATKGPGQLDHLKHRLHLIVHGGPPGQVSWVGRCLVLAVLFTLPLAPGLAQPPVDSVLCTDEDQVEVSDPPLAPASSPTPEKKQPTRPTLPEPERYGPRSRQVYTPSENDFPLLGVACSPDGTILAVCGEERTIRLVDAASGKTLHTLSGHEDVVAGVAFSPDGTLLASACYDGVVRLWQVATGKLLHSLQGHSNWVFAVAFAPDGQTLGSAGYDGTVRLWQVRSGQPLATLVKHRGSVRTMAFSPDGCVLASAGSDRVIRLWDLSTRQQIATLSGHDDLIRSLCFAPKGKRLVSGSEDGSVRLWDCAAGKQLAVMQLGSPVRAVAFSPRKASLASVAEDRQLRLHDPETLSVRQALTQHESSVTGLTYAADGRHLYTVGSDRTLRAWTGQIRTRPAQLTLPGVNRPMWVAQFAPDGRLAMAGEDGSLQVRSPRLAQLVGKLPAHPGAALAVAFSPDGRTLAVAGIDQCIHLYEWPSRKHLRTLTGHKFRVWSLAFAPDGKTLASAAGSWEKAEEPGEVKLWDIASGHEAASLSEPTASTQTVAFSPDGKTLAVGARDGMGWLYDRATLRPRVELKGHSGQVRCAVFSPDGQWLATGGGDRSVRLWDTRTGKEVGNLPGSHTGTNAVAFSPDGKHLAAASRPSGEGTQGEVFLYERVEGANGTHHYARRTLLRGHLEQVLSVAFSPDGRQLASAGGTFGRSGELLLWDVSEARLVARVQGHRQWIEALSYSRDGQMLISAAGSAEADSEVFCWKLDNAGWSVPQAHSSEILCAAWSPDGQILATGGSDRTIRLWNGVDGKPLGVLKGHRQPIRVLIFSPDGKALASGSADRTVKLWDVVSRSLSLEVTQHAKAITALAFSPDGKWLASGSADLLSRERKGEVKVHELATGKEVLDSAWTKQATMALAFSPDGKTLYTGSAGTEGVVLFEVATGKQLRTIPGTAPVRTLALSRDGRKLVCSQGTGSPQGEGSLQVWDVETWTQLEVLTGHNGLVVDLSLSRDGRLLASASGDGSVKVWSVSAPDEQDKNP